MGQRKRLIKLVRDRVNLFWQGSEDIVFEELSREQHIEELRKKLLEEATEYLLDPGIKELADVQQVVIDLSFLDLGLSPGHVHEELLRKQKERGGFQQGIGMYLYSDAPEAT